MQRALTKVRPFRFKPFSRRQRQVLTWWHPGSPHADKDMVICDGSIRSGKTIAMILSFLIWSQTCFGEQQNFILAGKTMGALMRNVIKPLLQILRALALDFNYVRSGPEPHITVGIHTYYLFGASNEAAQDTLQGITAAGALLDEGALFPQSFVEQAIGRCSVDGARIWLNCNPESPYHILKTEYIDKAEEKRILHLVFTLDDNLTLSERTKERYRRMHSGVFYKRYILGLWVAAEGAIWDMFDESRHVVDDHQVPELLSYTVSCDYGTTNPTVFLLVGRDDKRRRWVIDEWRWDSRERGRQMTDAEYSQAYRDWIARHGVTPRLLKIDPSAASFIAQLRQDGIRYVTEADNSVLDGIRRVGTLLANGKLFIHRRCQGLIREIQGYVWDPKAQERGEDKPIKKADHGPDALRYECDQEIGYTRAREGSWA